MTEIIDKIKQGAVTATIVGGTLGVFLASQNPSDTVVSIEPATINRADIVNINPSDIKREDLAKDDTVETSPEIVNESPPEIIESKPIITIGKPVPKTKKVVEKIKVFLKPKQFKDLEDPEPYDVYMKNNWDGNFLRSEGVNARFGKYKNLKN